MIQAPLQAVLEAFEHTGYCRFAYSIEDLPSTIINVDLTNVPVLKAVHSIFRNLPIKDSFLFVSNGRYCFSLYPEASPVTTRNLLPATVESFTNGIHQLNMATATGSVYVLPKPDRVISPN